MSEPDHRETLEPFDLEREPLDLRSFPDIIDWGGDGTDPYRPVRAHVLAALQPSTGPYAPPLDTLLTLGEIPATTRTRRAAELGIGQEHVPELVRMLRDRALSTSDSDDVIVWAPEHALHILAGLDLSQVVADILPIFDVDFERLNDDLIGIIGAIGSAALPATTAYLQDRTRWVWGRSRSADALRQIAEHDPDARPAVIAVLAETLAGAEDDHEQALTGVMYALMQLKADETLPLIRRAFELDRIDESVCGTWGDVLREFGITPDPDDPLVAESHQRFDARYNAMFPPSMRENLAALQQRYRNESVRSEPRANTSSHRKKDDARRQKNKRKAASATRKANRKKR